MDSQEVAINIRKLILGTYGKRLYETKKQNVVNRRFLLTSTKLQDILTVCGPHARLTECAEHLLNKNLEVHHALSKSELKRFLTVVRLGRCAVKKHGRKPAVFAPDDVLAFAQRLLKHVSRELETT